MLKRITSLIAAISIFMMILPIVPADAAKKKFEYESLNMIVGDDYYIRIGDIEADRIESSNQSVISTGNYATITAKKAGSANIKIYDYYDNSYGCKIKVYSKEQILKKIKVKYVYYRGTAIALITNNSPVMINASLKINYTNSKGNKKVKKDIILAFCTGQTSAIWLGQDVNDPVITYKIEGAELDYKDYSSKIKVTTEVQDDDVYVTLKNTSSVDIYTFDVTLLGYDDDNSLIFAETLALTGELDAKDTYEENIRLDYYWDDDEDEEVYLKPTKFTIFTRGYIET